MRCPAFAKFRQRLGFWHQSQAVGKAKAMPHAEVIDRQHIAASQVEHQQHLHGPRADATHLRQALDDCGVGLRCQLVHRWHHAAQALVSQIPECHEL